MYNYLMIKVTPQFSKFADEKARRNIIWGVQRSMDVIKVLLLRRLVLSCGGQWSPGNNVIHTKQLLRLSTRLICTFIVRSCNPNNKLDRTRKKQSFDKQIISSALSTLSENSDCTTRGTLLPQQFVKPLMHFARIT